VRRQPNGKACWQPYIKPPAECGTDAGYHRHRDTRGGRIPSEPCDDCKAAHAAAERARRARAQRGELTYRGHYWAPSSQRHTSSRVPETVAA
jgi:hypothetical protein